MWRDEKAYTHENEKSWGLGKTNMPTEKSSDFGFLSDTRTKLFLNLQIIQQRDNGNALIRITDRLNVQMFPYAGWFKALVAYNTEGGCWEYHFEQKMQRYECVTVTAQNY